MRGALSFNAELLEGVRIIPADAGSTPRRARMRPARGDHPRGCGEHKEVLITDVTPKGSSPRMRGAPPGVNHQKGAGRIIPADAGSTPRSCDSAGNGKDHPRGCGEHVALCLRLASDRGSSPRMRGAPGVTVAATWAWRIIPADAGSTHIGLSNAFGFQDHPRGCGEHCGWYA